MDPYPGSLPTAVSQLLCRDRPAVYDHGYTPGSGPVGYMYLFAGQILHGFAIWLLLVFGISLILRRVARSISGRRYAPPVQLLGPEPTARDRVELILETEVGLDSENQDEKLSKVEQDDGEGNGSYTEHKVPGRRDISGAASTEETSFSFREIARTPGVHVTGEVHVHPAPAECGPIASVRFVIAMDYDCIHLDPSIVTDSKDIRPSDNDLARTCNRSLVLSPSRPGKYKISVTLYLCRGKSLREFSISTNSLHITLHPDIDFSITNQWKLSTTAQPITLFPSSSPDSEPSSSNYSQREIIIYSASGSVSGTYPLFDLLSITTIAGTIDIDISPRPANSTLQTPASLVLASSSGSIRADVLDIHQSGHKIPERIYRSRLSTISGSISAKLLHTLATTLLSTSGQLFADIYPTSTSFPSSITTSGQSGSTGITVHPSLFSPHNAIKNLSGKHVNTSGSLKVRYPNTWEGKIQARTLSGRVGINWDGVKIIRDWGGKEVLAEKGVGEGDLVLESISGVVELGGTTV